MKGKAKQPGVCNVIPKPDAWAWKMKRILESPNSDTENCGDGIKSGGDMEVNRLPGWKIKLLDLSGLVGRVLPGLLHQTPEGDACSQISHFDLATGYTYF